MDSQTVACLKLFGLLIGYALFHVLWGAFIMFVFLRPPSKEKIEQMQRESLKDFLKEMK